MIKKILIIWLFLVVFSSYVSANVGFGMTDVGREIILNSGQNEGCITYYLYNPGDVDIEGFLDIDKESGGTLNKILGLDELYKELDILMIRQNALNEEYKSIPSGESTFEIEKKLNEVGEEISKINQEVNDKKPNQNKILILAHTKPKDENGNFQIPLELCMERPTTKYLLFFKVGNTDYCGTYEGEVTGQYTPVVKQGNEYVTGSAVTGSRSTPLKVTVRCDVNEKAKYNIIFIVICLIIIALISLLVYYLRKRKKTKTLPEVKEIPET